jgi:hypothetical protein
MVNVILTVRIFACGIMPLELRPPLTPLLTLFVFGEPVGVQPVVKREFRMSMSLLIISYMHLLSIIHNSPDFFFNENIVYNYYR